jgi:hypothetical protein
MATVDSRIYNIHLDANALDRDGSTHDALVDRFETLRDAGALNVVVPGSVRREVAHPRTPANVRALILPGIYTLPVNRTGHELTTLVKIRVLLRGKAQPGRHDADAEHLFEASKYGGGYFITHDRRMLNKCEELAPLIGPALTILSLEGFLSVYDRFAAQTGSSQ